MDPSTTANPIAMLLALLPAAWVPYATAAFSILTTVVTAAAIVTALCKPPTTTSGAWYWIYTVVNWLAQNWGHAKSLAAPESTGIVGGPGATTAPKIATATVPLAQATPAQKAITVPPAA